MHQIKSLKMSENRLNAEAATTPLPGLPNGKLKTKLMRPEAGRRSKCTISHTEVENTKADRIRSAAYVSTLSILRRLAQSSFLGTPQNSAKLPQTPTWGTLLVHPGSPCSSFVHLHTVLHYMNLISGAAHQYTTHPLERA